MSSSIPRVFIGVVVASACAAAPAAARPSLTTDRACYAEGETITFSGQGFTAGATINFLLVGNGRIGTTQTTADAAGAFSYPLRAPTLKDFKAKPPQLGLGVTANDSTRFGPDGTIIGPPEDSFAPAELRVSVWDVDVPPWDKRRAVATAGQRIRLTTHGWASAGDDTLYIHYLRAGKVVHSEKVGALSGPCGDLTKTIKTFGFRTAKPGRYAVRFTTSSKWNSKAAWLGYRAVKLVG